MVNILNGQTDFKLRIEGSAIRETILVFLLFLFLILLSALRNDHGQSNGIAEKRTYR